ncbi:MAG: DUF445 family protein [Oscillospiraceae bacterium]|nr:DUF445 family protein [Oscillospiraceae bacterium]
MNYELVTGPLIGAFIGFITNGIAIRMLFRPWKAKYIGKFKVPFTPGLIPKEQPRIAKAIGGVVGNKLLDDETLKAALLSDDIKEKMNSFLNAKTQQLCTCDMKLSEYLDDKKLLEPIDTKEHDLKYKFANNITEKLVKNNIGGNLVDLASDELVKNANPMIASIANKAIKSARESLINKVHTLLREKGPDLIISFVDNEYGKMKDRPVSEYAALLSEKFPDMNEKIWSFYSGLIEKKLTHFLKSFSIEAIVEQKINDFDMQEMEKLIFSITKKELNALVYLGGILGLLMGFLNILL